MISPPLVHRPRAPRRLEDKASLAALLLARERAAAQREREAIISWLRSGTVGETCDDDEERADAIERGEHTSQATPKGTGQ